MTCSGVIRREFLGLGRLPSAAFGVVFGIAAFAAGAAAQGVTRETFADWQLRCEASAPAVAPQIGDAPTPDAAGEQCYLYQNIADESSDRLNLIITILRLPDPARPGQTRTVLRVLAPLGVLLPRGLGLKLDETEVGSTGFVRCWANACVAEVEMDQGLIERFTAARVATFFFAVSEDDVRGLPVRLDRLSDGLAALR